MRYAILALALLTCIYAQVDFKLEFEDIPDPVEIVFIMDSSGSMGSVVDDMRDDLYHFLDTLVASEYSFRLGTVTYGDGTSFWDFDVSSPEPNMTDSRVHFRALLDDMGVSGGGDWNETSIDAIYDGAEFYDWSPDTMRLMMMFTDAPFHVPGDGSGFSDVTPESTLVKLLEKEIRLYIAASTSSADANDWFDSLCRASGGARFPLPTFRDPLIPSWPDVFGAMFDSVRTRHDRNDIHGLPTTVQSIAGMELESIDIANLRPGLLRGADTIDLTGAEFDGLDSLNVIWEINDPLPLRIDSSEYTLTLHTTSGDYSESGVIRFFSDIDETHQLPGDLSISTYPNPFNCAVTISLDGVGTYCNMPLQIEIFDMNGRHIDQFSVGEGLKLSPSLIAKQTGGSESTLLHNSKFIWQPAAPLPSGIYLIRARIANSSNRGLKSFVSSTVATKRIVYLK